MLSCVNGLDGGLVRRRGGTAPLEIPCSSEIRNGQAVAAGGWEAVRRNDTLWYNRDAEGEPAASEPHAWLWPSHGAATALWSFATAAAAGARAVWYSSEEAASEAGARVTLPLPACPAMWRLWLLLRREEVCKSRLRRDVGRLSFLGSYPTPELMVMSLELGRAPAGR